MEVEIAMDDDSIVKHDQGVMKPTNEAEAISSGSPDLDISYHGDDNNDDDDGMVGDANDDDDDMADDAFDYEDDYDDSNYMFESPEEDDESHYLSMQAQFDNVDLPPGVEASFSWLDDLPKVTSTADGPSNSSPGAETHDHKIPNVPFCKSKDVASSSSSSVLPKTMPSSAPEKENANATEEEVKKKFDQFKLFDIVDDFSDHHFNSAGVQGHKPPRTWTKKIQDEWKILEKDLPDTIFVRAYETRMDLLRAVIVGPAGTPYHDGLFVFDIHFPPTYPQIPPMVYYYSGGLRLNPNLYACGKVCLSLLNTWTGRGNEKWVPSNSTMLQVLVSIQALILNDKPFFNEPGHDTYRGAEGEKKSKAYNENTFILSLKTMIYTLRKPQRLFTHRNNLSTLQGKRSGANDRHFEDLVVGHFRSRAHTILSACRAYMEGVEVGSKVDGGEKKGGSKSFKASVAKMVNGLVSNFSRYGATDCEQFRVES
ncbi:hypothetical protein OSB04_014265 [Centaurea solstitialis]|uniref:UBC core domain-containing protein n=1 Tax=Centaurea solstitialis TaxID=347529 RepID=A0AA38WFF8_9ASTR|nr:hypothetical protein OSB04_014265 [Centaurea solstitialis]